MRQINTKKRRGSREDKWTPLKKGSDNAIHSVANATQSEETDETDDEKAEEREKRGQTHSIGRLL